TSVETYQLVLNRVLHQLGGIAETELIKDVHFMSIYSLDAYEKLLRHFLVGLTIRHQRQHFLLTRRQIIAKSDFSRGLCEFLLVIELFKHQVCDRFVEVTSPVEHRVNCLVQGLNIDILRNITVDAALDTRLEQILPYLGRDNNHLDTVVLFLYPACGFDPGHSSHHDVHQHDVGALRRARINRLFTAFNRSDDLDIAVLTQQHG